MYITCSTKYSQGVVHMSSGVHENNLLFFLGLPAEKGFTESSLWTLTDIWFSHRCDFHVVIIMLGQVTLKFWFICFFLIRWHLPDELYKNLWFLVTVGSGSRWIPIQTKKKRELQWTHRQLNIFGIIYFSSDLLIIPNYNNKYFNLVVALIITFILISRQLWHSNNTHDFSRIIPVLRWDSHAKQLYFNNSLSQLSPTG